jgi:hypothetical protein
MPVPRSDPSSADVATEVNGLSTGLGIITMTFFPFALPGLLLALPLVLLVAPLALVGLVGYLVVRILVLLLRLARTVLQHRPHGPRAGDLSGSAAPAGRVARG